MIPTNMRTSVNHRLFDADPQTSGDSMENLIQGETEGKPVERRAVAVEGRKVARRRFEVAGEQAHGRFTAAEGR